MTGTDAKSASWYCPRGCPFLCRRLPTARLEIGRKYSRFDHDIGAFVSCLEYCTSHGLGGAIDVGVYFSGWLAIVRPETGRGSRSRSEPQCSPRWRSPKEATATAAGHWRRLSPGQAVLGVSTVRSVTATATATAGLCSLVQRLLPASQRRQQCTPILSGCGQ